MDYKRADIDFSSHAVKLKESGAEAVILPAVYRKPPRLAEQCHAISYNPLFIGLSPIVLDKTIELGGKHVEEVIGVEVWPLPTMFSKDPIRLGVLTFTVMDVGVIGSSLVIMLTLYLLFKWTETGVAMRATAQSQMAAQLMGVSVKQIFSLTWAISAGIGGIKAFAGAILGGFGSTPGAIIAGMLLGVMENLSGYFLNAGITQVSTYILLILVLIVRPSGLFGAVAMKKV